jgi:hypothetical protein
MTWSPADDAPIRDLTTRRLTTRTIRADHLSSYRDALEAHRRVEEATTSLYATEIRDHRILNPVPRFADFTKA